jgi:predicted signal transduction protein with EAL and GGDEF domain
LSVLADRITRTLDTDAIAGRIGGDEFVVVLPGHDIERAAAVAGRLVIVLGQPVHAEGRAMTSSVSVGVAAAPHHGRSSSDLLRNANAALYRAKHNGRNRVEVFDGAMQQQLATMLDAEQSLRRAIDNGEILPFFQPEIDATTGRVVGAEVLARWLRADGTMTSASEFIGVAQHAGLLERLTERVVLLARPDIRRMASLGLPDGFRFRVNLAPSSTDRSWHNNAIDELIRGIDPWLVTVDVCESAVMADLPGAAATLASFRAQGGRVCLDDFARGVSSLSLLRKLPVDEVRVDQLAIDTIAAHPHDRAIVRSIISVVREIGLAVTADGVETGAQADALIALGCIRHQGHLYARALSAERFEAYLVERQAEGYASTLHQVRDWATDELD